MAVPLTCLSVGVTSLRIQPTSMGWLSEGIYELGEPAVTELLLDWLTLVITETERDRVVGWHLGVSL